MAYTQQLLSTGEQILLERRQHWVGLVRPLISLIVRLVIIGLLVALLTGSTLPGPLRILRGLDFVRELFAVLDGLPNWWVYIAGLAVAGLNLLGFFNQLLTWLNTTYVLTSRRVIQVTGVLSKRSFDSSLEKINDINLSQSFWGRLLGYGTLSVMTASEMGFSSMHNLADPAGFKRAMLDAKNQLGSGITGVPMPPPGTITGQPATVADRLARLDQLKQQGYISAEEYATKRADVMREL